MRRILFPTALEYVWSMYVSTAPLLAGSQSNTSEQQFRSKSYEPNQNIGVCCARLIGGQLFA